MTATTSSSAWADPTDTSEPAARGRDLQLESVTKRFAGFTAVDDLHLRIPQGSFFALLGPSGCGKTTTLRMIAGLEEPTSGRILLGDTDVAGLKPYRRPVNTVFQNYALFPHLSIRENVAFGLRRRGIKDVKHQVDDMLELVELGSQGNKRPNQLSGGQQQRVALARALINKPEVLLLDEPLGALDLKLRRQMQIELKRIQTEVGITFVHVTHDQEEAMTMADTIAVMNAGLIEQLGAPADLYENPRTTFVANFLGQSNLLITDVVDTSGPYVVVDCHGQKVAVESSRSHTHSGSAWLGIRPEKLFVGPKDDEEYGSANMLSGGVISDVSFVGVSTQYLVRMPWDQEIMVFEQNTGQRSTFKNGDEVDVAWSRDHAFLLDADQDATAGVETGDE
jgi:spermidine/putrescine transport system ATP-binding protein